jgi:hypothetical protein
MIDRRTATMAVRFDSNADLERPQVCAVLMLMRTSEHASAQHGVMLPHTLMRLSGPWSALAEGCGAACTELYMWSWSMELVAWTHRSTAEPNKEPRVWGFIR